jgi:hypothetical protein
MLFTSPALAAVRQRLARAVRFAAPSIALLTPARLRRKRPDLFRRRFERHLLQLRRRHRSAAVLLDRGRDGGAQGPGLTIVVKPGVYREQITVGASGAAGSPFVFQGAGPGVVIDGADDFCERRAVGDVRGGHVPRLQRRLGGEAGLRGRRAASRPARAAPYAMPAGTLQLRHRPRACT